MPDISGHEMNMVSECSECGDMFFFLPRDNKGHVGCDKTCADPEPRGGGGTLFFFAYVGSDPASTVHPKIILGI